DLQNLKPANPSENSSRNNRYYDDISVGGVSYEPRDEVKGDLARILLYMWTMYDELELVNTNPTVHEMAMLDKILEWHELDPVDDFERNRNDIIFDYQKNRNPYIDYPEFVDLIWG
ncbi:MAG: endonuclease, partial [Candidatus Izemoplasmatales bacterium]